MAVLSHIRQVVTAVVSGSLPRGLSTRWYTKFYKLVLFVYGLMKPKSNSDDLLVPAHVMLRQFSPAKLWTTK